MAKQSTLNKSIFKFMGPKHWLSWFAMGIAYVLSFLPWSLQQGLGKYLGQALYAIAKRRRHICDVNLKICYPEMSDAERKKLTKAHFESMGKGTIETFSSWFQSQKKFQSRITFEGQDVVDKVLAKGRGCILISGHFSSLDLCGSQMPRFIDAHPIYKLQTNPVMNWVMERQRKAIFSKTIERTNMREVLKSLKQNKAVWYAVDQDYGRKNSVFAPFYGHQCATIAHIGRIANMTNAPVVLYDYGRTKNGYLLKLTEVENYPSQDDVENATRINELMEKVIEPKKEQYYWTHRRFKTQPIHGDPSPYDK
ncbi:lipid A biosynthesis acyltransferase [Marinomonas sp. UCMA 3892]|jgi:Kdo2-lipid IVA lauroyltransferase/acyltransferase|uniref:Lipid A biosynthesis acyltransferase n=1 Tax=Marinomonas sp. (strain MWYL1) TaxID=400668 RepID=A6VVZ0_MARMS|nr:lysophospholipid acyltransferase family protein [Marinomonas sp. UCMA 3892]NLV00818.1 lipid A biosynthesis acyltransferase [Marinomonas sp. UCMA 3892]